MIPRMGISPGEINRPRSLARFASPPPRILASSGIQVLKPDSLNDNIQYLGGGKLKGTLTTENLSSWSRFKIHPLDLLVKRLGYNMTNTMTSLEKCLSRNIKADRGKEEGVYVGRNGKPRMTGASRGNWRRGAGF
ncbi:hypothetical protein KQX54_019161 [Cotesia glomerata]|uniref:Uncharacterized protein n=1 Tax=Cotesia glomerata TaxID=32391 RepID=A0AAV7HTK1_COTGL|nr:hypothetical protein KQX54_019161 [Cotesia glomerata]